MIWYHKMFFLQWVFLQKGKIGTEGTKMWYGASTPNTQPSSRWCAQFGRASHMRTLLPTPGITSLGFQQPSISCLNYLWSSQYSFSPAWGLVYNFLKWPIIFMPQIPRKIYVSGLVRSSRPRDKWADSFPLKFPNTMISILQQLATLFSSSLLTTMQRP